MTSSYLTHSPVPIFIINTHMAMKFTTSSLPLFVLTIMEPSHLMKRKQAPFNFLIWISYQRKLAHQIKLCWMRMCGGWVVGIKVVLGWRGCVIVRRYLARGSTPAVSIRRNHTVSQSVKIL